MESSAIKPQAKVSEFLQRSDGQRNWREVESIYSEESGEGIKKQLFNIASFLKEH